MQTSYAFSTLTTNMMIISGDQTADHLGCVRVNFTPIISSSIRIALRYVPLIVLILVGIATVTAAMYSPWGTTDMYSWTTNFSGDDDILRLVTPGFADCLQYIQFIVLTSALSLDYPGYYQPAVSQASWSSLMFNESFVSGGSGLDPVVDGVYSVNGTGGLHRFTQLVGLESVNDTWPGMMVWLLSIIAAVMVCVQMRFVFRWIYRQAVHIPVEDRRPKNLPFTFGNVIRITFNYLFLPLTAISFFQLDTAANAPKYSVALAAVVIFFLIAFFLWALRVMLTTRPRSYLFEDISTLLLYGPFYNTYTESTVSYSAISVSLNFIRGLAIGAAQRSGIAQIVLLALCEVFTIVTIVTYRPFAKPTVMNIYQTCFAVVRLLTVLLSIGFIPSLHVIEGSRGWIGYIILALHAVVLVFGFFLNSLQTFIEIAARLAGVGDSSGGATRGGLVKVGSFHCFSLFLRDTDLLLFFNRFLVCDSWHDVGPGEQV